MVKFMESYDFVLPDDDGRPALAAIRVNFVENEFLVEKYIHGLS